MWPSTPSASPPPTHQAKSEELTRPYGNREEGASCPPRRRSLLLIAATTASRIATIIDIELTELPRSLLVVGGNAVDLEQAQLFARLGIKITVVEILDRLTPLEDAVAFASTAFEQRD